MVRSIVAYCTYVLATVCAYGFGVIYCAVEISSTQDKNAVGKLKREQLCADLRNKGLRRPFVARRCSQN